MVTAPYHPISSLLYVTGHLREVKNKRKFQFLALKVVAVAYERCSFTRGSQCSDLAKECLVFWKTESLRRRGRLRDVVATGGFTVVREGSWPILSWPFGFTDMCFIFFTLRFHYCLVITGKSLCSA